jgi:hypothetical protein
VTIVVDHSGVAQPLALNAEARGTVRAKAYDAANDAMRGDADREKVARIFRGSDAPATPVPLAARRRQPVSPLVAAMEAVAKVASHRKRRRFIKRCPQERDVQPVEYSLF